jgi:hypothetical protein
MAKRRFSPSGSKAGDGHFARRSAENLNAEYEALGMMISGSPLSFYKDILASRAYHASQ